MTPVMGEENTTEVNRPVHFSRGFPIDLSLHEMHDMMEMYIYIYMKIKPPSFSVA